MEWNGINGWMDEKDSQENSLVSIICVMKG
jgi:hypothetical protein